MQKHRILIIRLSSIGDILLTTPFIRQVYRKFSNAQIDFILKEEFKDLLQENPYVQNLIALQTNAKIKDLSKIKDKLRQVEYDYIFDLHNNWRSNYLRRGLKAKYIGVINKDKVRQILLVYLKKNYFKRVISIPERYLDVARTLHVEDDEQGLELYWNKKVEKDFEILLFEFKLNSKYICIAPGAGFFTKRWPIEYFEELVALIRKRLSFKIVILGGDDETMLGEILQKQPGVINLCGKLGLLGNAIVLSKSLALISNDSGLMHMATAVHIPVLAIFGSSVKELGFYPSGSKNIVIANSALKCRPCSHIGRKSCPRKHFRCMRDIKPDLVIKQFNKLMA